MAIITSIECVRFDTLPERFPQYDWFPSGGDEHLSEASAANGSPNEFLPVRTAPIANAMYRDVLRRQSAAAAASAPAAAAVVNSAPASRALSRRQSLRLAARPEAKLPPSTLAGVSSRSQNVATMPAAGRATENISLLSHLESAMPRDLRITGVNFGDARMPPLVLQYSDTKTASTLLRSVTVRGHTDAAAMHPHCAPIYNRTIYNLAFALVIFDW